jgi:hypothetical protein
MKIRFPLAFAVILAVTAVAGGCSDAPMAPAPEEAGLGPPARRNVSSDPLKVAVHCNYHKYGWIYDPELFCQATASDGTGTGYTFSWSLGTVDALTEGANSYVSTPCYYLGSYSETWVQVWDSGGGFAQVNIGPSQCFFNDPAFYNPPYYGWADHWYYSDGYFVGYW